MIHEFSLSDPNTWVTSIISFGIALYVFKWFVIDTIKDIIKDWKKK